MTRVVQLPSHFTATHQTAGLPGYPAVDVFAPAGSPVASPIAGTVRKLSGHAPTSTAQPGGPYGWSLYLHEPLSGDDFYLTHFGSRKVQLGQKVTRGQIIGTVADYAHATNGATPSHIHEGRHPGP